MTERDRLVPYTRYATHSSRHKFRRWLLMHDWSMPETANCIVSRNTWKQVHFHIGLDSQLKKLRIIKTLKHIVADQHTHKQKSAQAKRMNMQANSTTSNLSLSLRCSVSNSFGNEFAWLAPNQTKQTVECASLLSKLGTPTNQASISLPSTSQTGLSDNSSDVPYWQEEKKKSFSFYYCLWVHWSMLA